MVASEQKNNKNVMISRNEKETRCIEIIFYVLPIKRSRQNVSFLGERSNLVEGGVGCKGLVLKYESGRLTGRPLVNSVIPCLLS